MLTKILTYKHLQSLKFQFFSLLMNSPFVAITICTAKAPASDFRHMLIPDEKVKVLPLILLKSHYIFLLQEEDKV